MNSFPKSASRKPFIEHIHELQRRLLVSLVFIVVGSGVGYSINDTLARLIQQPLGEKLYFTSPTGGFNFIFMLCLSFGLLVALPCIIYQILAFISPVLPHSQRATRFWYPICSIVLAVLGVGFAYFISLPAALHFLTNIGGNANIESLITTDAYFRFALTYIVGTGVLFQLPLLLIIINRISPLKPGKLMGFQRYVVLGSFIVAAILTPTPDPFNQVLMAGPIIVLYQLSVITIWLRNKKRSTSEKRVAMPPSVVAEPEPIEATNAQVAPPPARRLARDITAPPPRRLIRDITVPRVAPRNSFPDRRVNVAAQERFYPTGEPQL